VALEFQFIVVELLPQEAWQPFDKVKFLEHVVIFLLVWDFYWRLFSLFLGPFLGAKKSPFLTPFAQPNQRENY
jgi:hypothetical protein